jgi:hypothetical protein
MCFPFLAGWSTPSYDERSCRLHSHPGNMPLPLTLWSDLHERDEEMRTFFGFLCQNCSIVTAICRDMIDVGCRTSQINSVAIKTQGLENAAVEQRSVSFLTRPTSPLVVRLACMLKSLSYRNPVRGCHVLMYSTVGRVAHTYRS